MRKPRQSMLLSLCCSKGATPSIQDLGRVPVGVTVLVGVSLGVEVKVGV